MSAMVDRQVLSSMADSKNNPPGQRPIEDDDVRRTLDDAADSAQRPHDDTEQREDRREAAREAERSPRREGEGIHPGSH
jgi:hypothetical protein